MIGAARSEAERLFGRAVVGATPLSGGCVGQVVRLDLDDGRRIVAKQGPGLEAEAFMLGWLTRHTALPMPALHLASDALILMQFVATGGPFAAEDAADRLAALHGHSSDHFGFERDTVIGGLPQPNRPTGQWCQFLAEQRLVFMAGQAHAAGRLPAALLGRIEALAQRLPDWLDEPPAPALVHGDAWGGNILCRGGRVAAFIDPAIHYADAEVELAFGTLFGTFDDRFFARYAEHRPLRPGFWERRDLLNLYPLLVHVRLFGGSYVDQVDRVVRRYVG